MNITCSGCGKKYRIDDSKIPASGKAVMKCPGCGNRLEIRAPGYSEDQAPSSDALQGSQPASYSETPQGSYQETANTEPAGPGSAGGPSAPEADEEAGLEFFEPGTKTALVFCPDYEAMTQIETKLREEGYEVRSVSSVSEVQARFRFHVYDLIILYQSGPEPENRLQEILNWINNISMDVRRQILVLHISMNGNRFDTMQAFSMGVDATISPLDIAMLPEVLEKVNGTKEATYMVFNECLSRVREEVA